MRGIDLRAALLFERAGPRLADDTDNLAREFFIAPDREPLPDGRGLGSKMFDRNLPVHDHDLWRAGIVSFTERPASEDRNLQGFEISGRDRGPTRVGRFIRSQWLAF